MEYVGRAPGTYISPQEIVLLYSMVAINEPETYGGTEIASQVIDEDVAAGLTNIAKR